MFMCGPHWRMVPLHLKDKIWKHYRPLQEVDKQPSAKYLKWAGKAVEAVAQKEGL